MRLTKFLTFITCYVIGAAAPIFAQTQTPPPKVGYIRFWTMMPATNGTFEVREATASRSESITLVGTAYRLSGYGDYPVGRYHLGVFKRGDDRPLKTFDVDLRPESFFTILMSPNSIETFEDTIDPKSNSGTLTVRNYFSGTTIAVSTNSQIIVEALPFGQSYAVSGLALTHVPITVRATLPNKRPVEAGAEIDFSSAKRATLLVVPDPYGRFRARATPDGKNF